MHYYDELPRHRWNSIIIIVGVLFRSKNRRGKKHYWRNVESEQKKKKMYHKNNITVSLGKYKMHETKFYRPEDVL